MVHGSRQVFFINVCARFPPRQLAPFDPKYTELTLVGENHFSLERYNFLIICIYMSGERKALLVIEIKSFLRATRS